MKKSVLLLALASFTIASTANANWLEDLARAANEKPWDKAKRKAEEQRDQIIVASLARKDVPMVDVSAYSTDAFNLSSPTIDPTYSGHNLGILWDKMNEMLAPKGKFESTADYEKRKASISSAPLIGNLNANNIYVAKKTLVPSNITYDADKQKLTAFFLSDNEPCNLKNSFHYTIYTDYRARQDYSEYTGENGFGATSQIKKFVSSRVDLAGVNIKSAFEKAPEGQRRFGFEMSATPAEAQNLESNLATLIFFKPKAPYTAGVKWSYTPTRQAPFDVDLDRHVLFCDITSVWLYDTRDGRILHKKSYS